MRHKLLAGIIPFCSGKRKPSTFTSSSLTDCNHITTNNNMLHSKSTYFYRWSSRYISIAPIACALTLLVGTGLFLNPAAKAQEVYAAGESGPATTGSSISFSFNNNTQPNTSTTVEPGYVSYIPNVFAVNTTNIYKYDMYITAAEGHTEELVGTTYHGIINGVGSNIAPDNFGENTWGYAFSTDTTVEDSAMAYSTLPAHGTKVNPQYSTDYNLNDTESREFKIVFAARIMGDTRPADHYYSQALISVVAESKEIVEGFGGVQTMQEFTPEICKHKVSAGTTGRLEDTRKNADGSTRVYWVAKLADGNCWMTQNLDLDLVAGRPLTPEDSDVTENWDPGVNTLTTKEDYKKLWQSKNFTVQSFDPGMWIYTKPSDWAECQYLNSASCSQWLELNSREWSVDIGIPAGTSSQIVNKDEHTYDAHYLVGNYYSYSAATVGIGTNVDQPASSSICPKNWKLPNKNSTSSYAELFTAENMTDSNYKQKIKYAPFYFVPGGYFEDSGGVENSSADGVYVIKTDRKDTNDYAYAFVFRSGEFKPSGSSNNFGYIYGYSGKTVRCVVPGN